MENDSDTKKATPSEMLIDDVNVWRGESAELRRIQEAIARYGSGEIPQAHSSLLDHWDCSEGNTLNYYEDLDREGSVYFLEAKNPLIVEVTDKPRRFVRLKVNTVYGAEKVSPTVAENGDIVFGTQITFTAPKAVFLDRYRRELDGDSHDAYYRLEATRAVLSSGDQIDASGALSH